MIVIGDGYAAAVGVYAFEVLKAKERCVAKSAHQPASIPRTSRLSAVLNDNQIVLFRRAHDWIHVTRMTVKMCRDDRTGAFSDRSFDIFRDDVEGQRIDVHEDGNQTGAPGH